MTPRLRQLAFFALQRAIGSRAGLAYRRMLDMERWPPERLRAWQERRLEALLKAAVAHTRFYRERFGAGATPAWASFPIITKATLNASFRELMSDALSREYDAGPPRGYGWLEVTSGGTTGAPTKVIHDAEFRDLDRAARAYEQHLCGFPFGTPHIRLWGSMHDIQRTRASLRARVMARLSAERLLNAFQMEDDRIRSYIRIMNECGAAYMIAYVDAIQQIARFAVREGLAMRPYTAIMTTGGTLTEDTRAELQSVFRARIHNKYGSRDAGELACECERGGLHLLPHVLAEVVDEHGRPRPAGEAGRLLVTFLGNHAFPIIRYDIEDIAALSARACPCGRPFPLLDRVEGRAADVLFSSAGGFVSPVYIRHIVGVVHGRGKIRRYQMVQHAAAEYTLTVQPEPGVRGEEIDALTPPLRRDLLAVLGADARLTIQTAANIPETPGGKFRYLINRYRTA